MYLGIFVYRHPNTIDFNDSSNIVGHKIERKQKKRDIKIKDNHSK